jgi:hypothetical protein
MAYQFSPAAMVGRPVSDGTGGQVIEFALGYDPDTDLIVLMAVMLTATDRDDTLELHFGIRTRIAEGDASPPDYTKESIDTYIPKTSRTIVRDLIRRCIVRIVPEASPKYIIHGNLLSKSRAKGTPEI